LPSAERSAVNRKGNREQVKGVAALTVRFSGMIREPEIQMKTHALAILGVLTRQSLGFGCGLSLSQIEAARKFRSRLFFGADHRPAGREFVFEV
jgi:hypothetical protein